MPQHARAFRERGANVRKLQLAAHLIIDLRAHEAHRDVAEGQREYRKQDVIGESLSRVANDEHGDGGDQPEQEARKPPRRPLRGAPSHKGRKGKGNAEAAEHELERSPKAIDEPAVDRPAIHIIHQPVNELPEGSLSCFAEREDVGKHPQGQYHKAQCYHALDNPVDKDRQEPKRQPSESHTRQH